MNAMLVLIIVFSLIAGALIHRLYIFTTNHVGKLKYVVDNEDGQRYMYMELHDPNVDKILNKRFIILKVDHGTQK